MRAPNAGGFFVGDYEGLAPHGASVQPCFVEATGTSGPASTAGFSGLLPVRGWTSAPAANAATVNAAARPVHPAVQVGRRSR
jgi:hypothetical protein